MSSHNVALTNNAPSAAWGDNAAPLYSEAQLPVGKVITGKNGDYPLSESLRSEFSAIDTPEGIYLLVSCELVIIPRIFNLSAGLEKKFSKPVSVLKVTPALLKIIYAGLNTGVPEAADRTPVERLLHEILTDSVMRDVSDIHIESRVRIASVFFRINRRRFHYRDLTHEEAKSLGQVMYGTYCEPGSKATTWSTLGRADGAFEWVVEDGRNYTFRFSSAPIHPTGGFHIVLRVLSMGAVGLDLPRLGYSQEQLAAIESMTSTNSGLMLFGGATNSGKSTSIQAALREVYARYGDSIKVLTVEEPVEYVIPGACQIPVARRKLANGTWDASAFTDAILGALRQDPDLMMVGEIRDADSASVVKDFVLAGRFMVSTVHVYSFMGVFRRLLEIKVPWEVVTMDGFWSGIVYQRLISRLCTKCSIPWASRPATLSHNFVDRVNAVIEANPIANIRLLGSGCPQCRNTGVVGMTICAEVWQPTAEFMTLLAAGHDREARALWEREGGIPIINHAISKMINGEISPLDVEQNIGQLPVCRKIFVNEKNSALVAL